MIKKLKIKRLRKELESKEDIYDEISGNCWATACKKMHEGDKSITFDSIEKDVENKTMSLHEVICNLSFELKKLEPIKYKDLDDIGHHMTFEDFKECVMTGGFIDYDGYGYYSTIDKQSNKLIIPSNFKGNRILDNKIFTHVKWYNR